MKAPSAPSYEFGDFRLDTARRLLSRNGEPVSLTPRVFETLLYLVEHHDAVLDKERLMEAVWPDTIVEENNLAQNISTLRRLFGETPGAHRFIATVPGRGYRFVAEVRTAQETNTPVEHSILAPALSEPVVAQAPAIVLARETRPFAVALLLILTLLTGAILFWRGHRQQSLTAVAPTSTSLPTELRPEKSIAVLPFENLSADPRASI